MSKLLITAIMSASAIVGGFFVTPLAAAQSDPIYTSWNSNKAVVGYDVTSFFDGRPVKGEKTLAYEYKGAEWFFSSQENLDKFKDDPDAYVPQYGGYCAWALANNKLAKGSPKHWNVKDGKLYLNFNSRVKQKWLEDQTNLIAKADANWPSVLD